MSWPVYLCLITFFTLVFAVFYAIAFSVMRGIHDNYLQYYQKADLQWTENRRKTDSKSMRFTWLLLISILTSWIVVHLVVQPY